MYRLGIKYVAFMDIGTLSTLSGIHRSALNDLPPLDSREMIMTDHKDVIHESRVVGECNGIGKFDLKVKISSLESRKVALYEDWQYTLPWLKGQDLYTRLHLSWTTNENGSVDQYELSVIQMHSFASWGTHYFFLGCY